MRNAFLLLSCLLAVVCCARGANNCTSRVSPDVELAPGKPDLVFGGFNICRVTPAQLKRRLGPPTRVEETPPQPPSGLYPDIGDRTYIWRGRGFVVRVDTAYNAKTNADIGVAYIKATCTGNAGVCQAGSWRTKRGLGLGDSLRKAESLYPHLAEFWAGSAYFLVWRRTSLTIGIRHGRVAWLQVESDPYP